MTTPDRRGYERTRLWLPVFISREGTRLLAVTYDLSESGVLLLASRSFPVGAVLSLSFEMLGAPARALEGKGRVVYDRRNEADPNGLWPRRLGVEFEEPMAELRQAIEALMQR